MSRNREAYAKYQKEYREKNKEKIANYFKENKEKLDENRKEYREKNKERIAKRNKEYRVKNKEKIDKHNKEYYRKNKKKTLKNQKEYREKNKEKIAKFNEGWREKNKEKINKYKREWRKKKKKLIHTLSDIKSFFISKKWPYATEGKNDVTYQMIEVIKDVKPQDNSFLSMPHMGRELSLLKPVLNISNSIGVEKDFKTWNTIITYLLKYFPGFNIVRDDINQFIEGTDSTFDVAHLDYNGPLLDKYVESAHTLLEKGTLTFVTISEHIKFIKNPKFDVQSIDKLINKFDVVYDNAYSGLRSHPMRTIGLLNV